MFSSFDCITFVWAAQALANNVFPVPGGPYNKTPEKNKKCQEYSWGVLTMFVDFHRAFSVSFFGHDIYDCDLQIFKFYWYPKQTLQADQRQGMAN